MIRIELDEATVARTRISISPLWETVCSLFLLERYPGEVPFPYTSWARRARSALTDDSAGLLRALAAHGWPDFLSPVPSSADPAFEDELDVVRLGEPEVVRAQLARDYPHGIPDAYQQFDSRPREALSRTADVLADYWSKAVEPVWPAMRSALEEEVLLRARMLAAAGPDALLTGLRDRVTWQPPVLTLTKQHDFSFTAADARLVLIPLLFSKGALMCSTDLVAVSYQARGAVVLADGPVARTAAPRPDRLDLLLGHARAEILRTLATPSTTAGLAGRLGTAPSTVSEHLANLHAAGMVARARAGRRVFYSLTPDAASLLELIGDGERLRAG